MTDTELYGRVLNEFTEGFGNKYELYLPFTQGDWTIASNGHQIVGLSNRLKGIPRIERTSSMDFLHFLESSTEPMGYLSVAEIHDDLDDGNIFTTIRIGEFHFTTRSIHDLRKLSGMLGINTWKVDRLEVSDRKPRVKCMIFSDKDRVVQFCMVGLTPFESAKIITISLTESSCPSSLDLEKGKQFTIELNYEKVGKQISRKKLWSVTVNRVSHVAVVAENEEEARNIASQHLNDTYFDEGVAKLGLELPERIDIDYCSRFNRVYSRIGVMTPEEFQNRLEQLRDFMADR